MKKKQNKRKQQQQQQQQQVNSQPAATIISTCRISAQTQLVRHGSAQSLLLIG